LSTFAAVPMNGFVYVRPFNPTVNPGNDTGAAI